MINDQFNFNKHSLQFFKVAAKKNKLLQQKRGDLSKPASENNNKNVTYWSTIRQLE